MQKLSYPDPHHDLTSNTLFGFWVYLLTDTVMFASFFATYAVLQVHAEKLPFNMSFALLATCTLLLSSFSIGIAMVKAAQDKKCSFFLWLFTSFFLGVLFVWMGLYEFNHFMKMGYTWKTNGYLSSYFTLIGLHDLHLLIGLFFMIVFTVQALQKGFQAFVLRRLSCLKLYWHFLYLIWIFTFSIIYLIGGH